MDKQHKNAPHKHAELIKAWADGAEIELLDSGRWYSYKEGQNPAWNPEFTYRIKPEPKPDMCLFYLATRNHGIHISSKIHEHNLVLTFDGVTDKLKSAEVL